MQILKIITYIKSDLYRYTGKITFFIFLSHLLRQRGFKYTFWFRLAYSNNIILKIISKAMHNRLSNKYIILIPRGTKIGYGLYLGHATSIVVNPSAIIGNNCNLSQFTTIGSNEGNAAIIGDNVYIGPNVCIVENVVIGNNCTIGAGAVVTKNIFDNTTAAGVPAKTISQKEPGRYIFNKWLLEEMR
jgi:serine O-acetyltransferase